MSILAFRLSLQQRALARPELHQRSRTFHEASARQLASRLIAGESDGAA